MEILQYPLLALLLSMGNLLIYLNCNKGLARNAKGLQTRRYSIASLLAVLPLAVAQQPVYSPGILFLLALSFICGITFPVIYHLSNRKQSPDYDHRIDLVYGIYLFGWLCALKIAVAYIDNNILNTILCIIIGIVAFAAALLSVIQWGYFFIYGTGFNTDSMQLLQDTDRNEAIEFTKSFNKYIVATIILAIILILSACIWGSTLSLGASTTIVGLLFSTLWAVAFTKYIWIGKRSLLCRTGFVLMYLDVKEYGERIKLYTKEQETRLKNLELKLKTPPAKEPHTYIIVIGESSSRDYMSAYTTMEHNTTPWQYRCKKESQRNVIFPNAYACANQTVPSLERILTERNQYNTKEFYESVSIVDIARKAGYTTHWYSNQGVVGAAETSITLVANTCDHAKWTKQELNKVQYDEALLDFLSEVDPTKNNLIFFHLMGSHFNFINRYPEEATKWGEPGVQDNTLNYLNSIHYTDTLLENIYNYACDKLNLQALIYFSDHACVPDKRRVAHFTGFGTLRIPLSIHCTDSYIASHKKQFEALISNHDKYFTNDLVYELFCGMLDIESNHFDKENSLASTSYKHTRDTLLTNGGQTPINQDTR